MIPRALVRPSQDDDQPVSANPGPQYGAAPIPDTSGPTDFFASTYERYTLAVAAVGGSVDRYYRIGGFPIRLRFAGPALLPAITPALAHLAVPALPQPALTICLWDSISTGVALPHPGWKTGDYRERGEVRGYNDSRIRTVFQVGPNILSLLDTETNLAVYWVQAAEQIPYYETGAPLRMILELWMERHDRYFIHAGAVGTSRGGVLLVGKGGSGKSTTALACLGSALRYAADDYCLLSGGPNAQVYSLYSAAKKDADDIDRLPFLVPSITNADHLEREKALYFLSERFSDHVITQFPLRAILIPRISGKDGIKLEAASPARGLAAMAPSSIFQFPGAGQSAFAAMGKIVRQIPCYYLNPGNNLAYIPAAILDLLGAS